MRRFWGIIMLAAMLFTAAAQAEGTNLPADTARVYCFEGQVDYQYQDERLDVGIKRVQTDTLTYFVADIQAADASVFRSAMASYYENDKKGTKREKTSTIAQAHDAVLAINADNCKSFDTGVLLREGEWVRPARDCSRHLLYVLPNGDLQMVSDRKNNSAEELAELMDSQGVQHSFEFGPVLVENGQATDLQSYRNRFKLISLGKVREPRTAIGQLDELRYIVLVVDGRREGYSKGVTLEELQQIFVLYGAQSAFNLDGGGSTTLVFQGEAINRPSGPRERGVSDILYFK